MIITDGDIEKGGKFLSFAQKPPFDILNEPMGPILVRNIHIEDGKAKVGVVEQNLRHWDIDHFARARTVFILVLQDSGKLESLAVVAKIDPVAGQMLPHRSGLRVILWNQRSV